MIRGSLARVVGQTSLLRDYGVGTGSEHNVSAQALLLENLISLIGNDISTGHVNVESAPPKSVLNASRLVRRHKDSGREHNRIEPAISQHDVLKQPRDTLAIRDVAKQTNGRTTVADSRSGDADALAILRDNFLRRFFRGGPVHVDAHDVGAF